MSALNNPTKVPACGPYGRAVWSADAGRWVRRLTAEGNRVADEWLAQHPNPAGLLFDVFPGVAAAALAAGIEQDDLAQLARLAVVNATAVYDPARGTKLGTVVAWHVRGRVQDAIGRADQTRRPADGPRVIRFGSDWDKEAQQEMCRAADIKDDAEPLSAEVERRDEARRVWAAIRQLRPRWQEIIGLRMAGYTLRECAKRLGVSCERVRQLEKAAREELRELLTGGGA